jgi:2-dehydropantoate 2-reductase
MVSVGIAGGGALGVALAHLLRRGGVDVRVLTASAASAARLRAGVRVVEGGAGRRQRFAASHEPEALAGCGVVLVAVKAYDTAAAAAALARVLPPSAIAATVQNGLGNLEALRDALPGHAVVAGATAVGAHRPSSGRVVIAGVGETVLAGEAAAAAAVAAVLRAAGLPVAVAADPDAVVWKKAIVSAAINPVAALLGVPNGMLLADADAVRVQAAVIGEACAVARACGVAADETALLERVRAVCAATAANRCSLLADLDAGRRTEIDAITGAIVGRGRAAGVPVAANEALLHLVRARERSGRPPRSLARMK